MSLRHQRPSDSLDMLLDTMCNTFGGIIMLAVLVTLLSSTERQSSNPTPPIDTQEMLRRRIAIAEENLRKAVELRTTWQAKVENERWKEQVELLATRQQLQEEIKAIQEAAEQGAKELDSSASSDPAERLKALNAQLMEAQLRKNSAQNSLAASKDNVERLNMRIAAMEKQAKDLVDNSQRQLRLPKEHETGKRVIYVIVRYGRIYPCRDSDLDRNETDIEWTLNRSDQIAEPIKGKGFDPSGNVTGLSKYFRDLSQNSAYVAFLVFEDSFPEFLRTKQIAIASGLTYGWQPWKLSRGAVTFVEDGYTPKPQ